MMDVTAVFSAACIIMGMPALLAVALEWSVKTFNQEGSDKLDMERVHAWTWLVSVGCLLVGLLVGLATVNFSS